MSYLTKSIEGARLLGADACSRRELMKAGADSASAKDSLSMLGFDLEDCCFEYFLNSAGYLEVFEASLAGLKPLGSFKFGSLFEISMLLVTIDLLALHGVHYSRYAHSELILSAEFFDDCLLYFIICEIKIHCFGCFTSDD